MNRLSRWWRARNRTIKSYVCADKMFRMSMRICHNHEAIQAHETSLDALEFRLLLLELRK